MQAVAPTPRRSLEVIAALTKSDLKVRYGRGRFTLVKWLLDPFAAVGVYLLLVAFVLNRRGFAVGLSIACAVVPFGSATGYVGPKSWSMRCEHASAISWKVALK